MVNAGMGMQNKLRVGVIFGGRSGEHEVSLMSARSILRALDPQKYSVTQIGLTYEGNWLVGENVLDALSQNRLELSVSRRHPPRSALAKCVPDRSPVAGRAAGEFG